MEQIKNFQFSRIPLLHFGPGAIEKLPVIIEGYGGKVVLLTGNLSFARSGYYQALMETFEKRSVNCIRIAIGSEPDAGLIDKVVSDLKMQEPDIIVAVGGGSVMDAGKAISAMLKTGGSVIDYLEEVGTKEHPGLKVPFIAVPTTSGTGSEATKNAVISGKGKNGFKRSLRHENFVPDIAIVDPRLTITCPPEITASSGMDCFSQLTEAYLSTKAGSYTDALAIEGLKAVKNSLLRAFNDGSDIEARTGMSFAALTSGICLANAGLGVVHGFASSIGGFYDIPHGLICGTLMAKANEATVRELLKSKTGSQALIKYAELGRIFSDNGKKTDRYYIESFIGYLYELTIILKLPGLKSAGVDALAVDKICEVTGSKNNPISLDKNSLKEILTERLV